MVHRPNWNVGSMQRKSSVLHILIRNLGLNFSKVVSEQKSLLSRDFVESLCTNFVMNLSEVSAVLMREGQFIALNQWTTMLDLHFEFAAGRCNQLISNREDLGNVRAMFDMLLSLIGLKIRVTLSAVKLYECIRLAASLNDRSMLKGVESPIQAIFSTIDLHAYDEVEGLASWKYLEQAIQISVDQESIQSKLEDILSVIDCAISPLQEFAYLPYVRDILVAGKQILFELNITESRGIVNTTALHTIILTSKGKKTQYLHGNLSYRLIEWMVFDDLTELLNRLSFYLPIDLVNNSVSNASMRHAKLLQRALNAIDRSKTSVSLADWDTCLQSLWLKVFECNLRQRDNLSIALDAVVEIQGLSFPGNVEKKAVLCSDLFRSLLIAACDVGELNWLCTVASTFVQDNKQLWYFLCSLLDSMGGTSELVKIVNSSFNKTLHDRVNGYQNINYYECAFVIHQSLSFHRRAALSLFRASVHLSKSTDGNNLSRSHLIG